MDGGAEGLGVAVCNNCRALRRSSKNRKTTFSSTRKATGLLFLETEKGDTENIVRRAASPAPGRADQSASGPLHEGIPLPANGSGRLQRVSRVSSTTN